MPQTASLFVLSTAGATGAFRIAIGFLLAVGPLAIMGLLFDATLGLFAGWVRALAGMALAALAALVVTAIDVMVVEGELAHLQALRMGGFGQSMDPQALTTIVIVFALVMLVSTLAALRMTSAFRLPWGKTLPSIRSERTVESVLRPGAPMLHVTQEQLGARARAAEQSRVAAIAEAVGATVRREQTMLLHAGGPGSSPRHDPVEPNATMAARGIGLGTIGRRTLARRTRTAARRDVMR
jgi:type IV secretion system protein VirB6